MEDTFLTIETPSEGIYKEKGSKFLSFAIPVQSEDELSLHIAALRKKYFDARHHCYAWRLGHNLAHYRSNDDGEPSGTAGLPILGQIRSNELTNILIVVVRYFGGVKLGVGGLVTAYKTAAADAIAQAHIIRKTVDDQITVNFDYLAMNAVMKILKDYQLSPQEPTYELRCKLTLVVRQSLTPQITLLLSKIEGCQYQLST